MWAINLILRLSVQWLLPHWDFSTPHTSTWGRWRRRSFPHKHITLGHAVGDLILSKISDDSLLRLLMIPYNVCKLHERLWTWTNTLFLLLRLRSSDTVEYQLLFNLGVNTLSLKYTWTYWSKKIYVGYNYKSWNFHASSGSLKSNFMTTNILSFCC